MARDPVCGMEVDKKTARYKSTYEGKTYYFCSPSCQKEFNRDPEKYIRKEGKEHHADHYGGFCSVGCGAPVRGVAWYFYVGLLFLSVLLLLLRR
ncbi:MAG: YHS domain-containing protein [Candidatus Brockarchaeota archaeon]|nr:YHS domain-containing protein [Candidatus Brockarchaeota archaeon]